MEAPSLTAETRRTTTKKSRVVAIPRGAEVENETACVGDTTCMWRRAGIQEESWDAFSGFQDAWGLGGLGVRLFSSVCSCRIVLAKPRPLQRQP